MPAHQTPTGLFAPQVRQNLHLLIWCRASSSAAISLLAIRFVEVTAECHTAPVVGAGLSQLSSLTFIALLLAPYLRLCLRRLQIKELMLARH